MNGNIDPWHALGFTGKPPNVNTHTVFINGNQKFKNLSIFIVMIAYFNFFFKGTAHCADMYPSGENDLESLVKARLQVSLILGSWLNTE